METRNKRDALLSREYSYYYGMSPDQVGEKLGNKNMFTLPYWIERHLTTLFYPYIPGDDVFTSPPPRG